MPSLGSPEGSTLDARLARFRERGTPRQAVPLARELLRAARPADALEVVRQAASLGGGPPELLLLEGEALLALGELIPAQAAFVKAARALPRDARPFAGLGRVLLERGDPMRALKALRKARALDPSDRAIVELLERARTAAGAPPSVRPPAPAAPPPRREPPGPAPEEALDPHEVPTALNEVPDLRARGGREPTFDDVTVKREAPVAPSAAPPPPFGAEDDEEPTRQWSDSLPPPPDMPQGVFATARAPHADAQAPAGAPPPPAAGAFATRGPLHAPDPSEAVPFAPDEPTRKAPEPAPAAAAASFAPDEPTRKAPEPALPPKEAEREAAPSVPPGDPAALLDALERQGLFLDRQGAAWADRREARGERPRLAGALGITWGVVLLLVGGGVLGWYQWLQARQGRAGELLEQASAAALRGDHEDLVDAERWLREARRLHPKRVEIPAETLFVLAQRALEEGRFESSLVRSAWSRARETGVSGPLLAAGEVLLLLTEGKRKEAASKFDEVPDSPEPRIAYLAGRLAGRLGRPEEARQRLDAALEAAPGFVAPRLALAEAALERGERQEALAQVEQVLQREPRHLRARLWRARLRADESEPEAGLGALQVFDEEVMKKAAPVDHVLLGMARARLLRRKGDRKAATEALQAAAEAGITDPRWLAELAREAQALQALPLAEALASRAMSSDAGEPSYRLLLAEILLQRRLGMRALRVLAPLSNEDPRVLRRSAEAALLVGSREAMEAASKALTAHLEGRDADAADPALRALSVRLRAHLGEVAPALEAARSLARKVPGHAEVTKALGDVALQARKVRLAVQTLGKLVEAEPRDAEAWYLLGRARRMAGDAAGAEEAFRKAVELAPSYADALVAFGYLLLDKGAWEEAEKLYASLARRAGPSGGASLALLGRVGRIEALVGLGRIEDARVQLGALRKKDAERPIVRLARARLALAEGKPSEAIEALQPLVKGERPSLQALSLQARALLRAGETEAAHRVVEQVLARDGGHPDALAVRAALLLRAGEHAKVVETVEAAMRSLQRRLRPPSLRAELLVLAARSLIEGSPADPAQAAKLLREATELAGAPAEAWFYLGEALAASDAGEARKAYERYLELDPDGPLAKRARRALKH